MNTDKVVIYWISVRERTAFFLAPWLKREQDFLVAQVQAERQRIGELEHEVSKLVPEITRLAADNDKLKERLIALRSVPAKAEEKVVIRARTSGDVRRQFEEIVGSMPSGE
jgi:regulator of replication initiation timing